MNDFAVESGAEMARVGRFVRDLSRSQNAEIGFAVFELESLDLSARMKDWLPDALRLAHIHRQKSYVAGRFAAEQAYRSHPRFLRWEQEWSSTQGFESFTNLLQDSGGLPLWAPGSCGSITHSKSFVASLVCLETRCNSTAVGSVLNLWLVGIDTETHMTRQRAKKIASRIGSLDELHLLREAVCDHVQPYTRVCAADHALDHALEETALFSAKEALFKAFYPLIKVYFGFEAFQLIRAVPDGSDALCLSFSCVQESLQEKMRMVHPENIIFEVHVFFGKLSIWSFVLQSSLN